MKKTFKIASVVLACAIPFLQGCKSNQSDVAPTAVSAATRPAAPGESVSTSGVFYSSWIPTPSWSARTNSANYVIYRTTINNITRLDQAMLDQGAILVYARFGGAGSETFGVPFQRIWSRISTSSLLAYEKWNYIATPNQLLITIDPEINGYTPSLDTQLRYILINGETATGRKGTIDYNNYEEVKAAYNLPD